MSVIVSQYFLWNLKVILVRVLIQHLQFFLQIINKEQCAQCLGVSVLSENHECLKYHRPHDAYMVFGSAAIERMFQENGVSILQQFENSGFALTPTYCSVASLNYFLNNDLLEYVKNSEELRFMISMELQYQDLLQQTYQ